MNQESILASFASLFSIIGGLNIGYAGSNRFRVAFLEQFLRHPNKVDKEIQEIIIDIEKKIKILKGTPKYNPTDEQNFIQLKNKYFKDIAGLKSKYAPHYEELFTAAFLNTAFFCLLFIAVIGYAQIMADLRTINILWLLNGAVLYNLFILILSLFKKVEAKLLYTLAPLIFLVSAIAFISLYSIRCSAPPTLWLEWFNIGMGYLILMSIFVALSPYIFYIFRSVRSIMSYNKEMEKLVLDDLAKFKRKQNYFEELEDGLDDIMPQSK